MEEKYYSRLIKTILLLGDLLLILVAILISTQFGFTENLSETESSSFFLIFSFSWISIGLLSGIYDVSKYTLIQSISVNLLSSLLIHFLTISLIQFSFDLFSGIQAIPILYLSTGLLMTGSRVFYKFAWKYFEFSGFNQRNVIIVGTTRSGKALHDFFTSGDPTGYVFKGFFDNYPNPDIVDRKLVKGTIDDLSTYCKSEDIDEIYFALPLVHKELLDRLSRFADDNCIYFRISPDFGEAVQNNHDVYVYDTIPVVTTRNEPLGSSFNAGLKRLFDIVFSLGVIVLLFPIIIPIIAFAIKIDSEGPIIFKQLRPGKKNRLFECYKFRTMYVNSASDKMATKNDSRITKVGAFLRKTSLDELPQFVNVLLGDMSVVGPRPNLISQLEEYSKSLKRYKVRHFVTPGITGYAQINGLRGEIEKKEVMAKRVEYDVAYMENWSLWLDLKIIFMTVRKLAKGDKHAY